MKILTHKIKNAHLPQNMRGWGNGYIGLPPEHPWYNKHYNDIECNVHGGLTYAANHPDGYWWIGFDTAHLYDNIHNCPESYVDKQIQLMKEQASLATQTIQKLKE